MSDFSPVEVSHRFVGALIREGDCCVDATLGNGHDTLFLASLVNTSGKVLGLDIQEEAVRKAQLRLQEAGMDDRVHIRNRGHEQLSDELQALEWESVNFVMFNLGYLPGSDKSIVTRAETTLAALQAGLKYLAKGGALSIVAYRGHEGGQEEYAMVESWFSELPESDYFCVRYERWNQNRGLTPVFFWIQHRS